MVLRGAKVRNGKDKKTGGPGVAVLLVDRSLRVLGGVKKSIECFICEL